MMLMSMMMRILTLVIGNRIKKNNMSRIYNKDDSVLELRGCGESTRKDFESCGILTLGDLVDADSTDSSYSVTSKRLIERFQDQAREKMGHKAIDKSQSVLHKVLSQENPKDSKQEPEDNNPSSICNHSWYERVAHIFVPTQKADRPRLIRVIIKELLLTKYGVSLVVEWLHRGKWKHKTCTPQYLMSIHSLWTLRKDAVVSSDEDAAIDDQQQSLRLPQYWCMDVDLSLPLTVPDETLSLFSTQDKSNLRHTLSEVQDLQYQSLCMYFTF
jgi:hypothetical protein